jgi:hypothetical protein
MRLKGHLREGRLEGVGQVNGLREVGEDGDGDETEDDQGDYYFLCAGGRTSSRERNLISLIVRLV